LYENSYFICNLQFDIPAVWGEICVVWAGNSDISKARVAFVFGVKQSNKIHYICVIFGTSFVGYVNGLNK
jgi:hypothetical protein